MAEHMLAIKLVIQTLILIFGMAGNFLTILIMIRPKFFSQATILFFLALAISDTGYLITAEGFSFAFEVLKTHSLIHPEMFCKFTSFFKNFFTGTSAWILVALAMERMVSVVKPRKLQAYFSWNRTGILILIIGFLSCIFNLDLLIANKVIEVQESKGINQTDILRICMYEGGAYAYFRERIRKIFIIILFVIIPFLLLMYTNITILYTLKKALSSLSIDEDLDIPEESRKVSWMLGLLIAASIMFIFLHLPLAIYQLLHDEETMIKNWNTPLLVYMDLSVSLGFAINFYLYVLIGPLFRRELYIMFCTGDREASNVTDAVIVDDNGSINMGTSTTGPGESMVQVPGESVTQAPGESIARMAVELATEEEQELIAESSTRSGTIALQI